MQREYLKEVSGLRDQLRPAVADAVQAAEFAVQGDKGLISFYEPLRYMNDETREVVTKIVEEKMKAIFAYDERCREMTNAAELMKFQDQQTVS